MEGFEEVVRGALSADNNVRKQAEEVFQQGRAHPDMFLGLLAQLLANSQDVSVRHFAGVMLRQNLKNADMWSKASLETRKGIKTSLLALFKSEENKTIRKCTTEAIGTLSNLLLPKNMWKELVPEILSCANSPHSSHRLSVLNVLEILCEYTIAAVEPFYAPLKQVSEAGLNDADPEVRVAAMKTVIALIISLDGKAPGFEPLIPLLFKTLGVAFEEKDDDLVKEALEELVNLPRCEPAFLREHIPNMINLMVPICLDTTMSSGSRRIAMEFLLSLAESGKGMIRKFREFSTRVIPAAFMFLQELSHADDWEKSIVDEDDEDADDNFRTGLDAVDRLATALGGRVFLPVASPMITQLLQNSDWKSQHAGLMAVSTMLLGCAKMLKPQLAEITNLTLPFVRNPQYHVRVRWAAVYTLGELAQAFPPTFHDDYYHVVLPAIVEAMNSNHQRLMSHAALCVVDLCRDATKKNLPMEITDSLLETLLKLLNVQNLKIQEGALSAVTAIAFIIEKDFCKYYASFIPVVKAILFNANGKEHRELRGKAMACVGLMAKAVGSEGFSMDASEVMDLLVTTQNRGFESDDPQFHYTVQALAAICECMGAAFVPYLPSCIPPLLRSADVQNAFSIEDADEHKGSAEEEEDGLDRVTLSFRGAGTKRITCNTALLEEKATACETLLLYATVLQENFFPYVEESAKVLIPLVKYVYHDGIRSAAIQLIPALMKAAQLHAHKNGGDIGVVQALFEASYIPFLEAINMESQREFLELQMDNLGLILEAFAEGIECCERHMISIDVINQLNIVLSTLITQSNDRRQKREARRNAPDFDEEAAEEIETENAEEDELLLQIHSLVSNLVKVTKGTYVPSFHQHLFPLIAPLLDPNGTEGMINTAICIIDDVIYNGEQEGVQYVDKFLPYIIQYAQNPNSVHITHSSVFGFGACAKAKKAQMPHRDQCLQIVLKLIADAGDIQNREADDEKSPYLDNCISCVGQIAANCFADGEEPKYQGMSLFDLWLTFLPVPPDGDEIEAQNVHAHLCDLVLTNNPHLLRNPANLPKIINILSTIIGTAVVTDQTMEKIIDIWRVIKTSMPQSISPIIASLNSAQQANLAELVKHA